MSEAVVFIVLAICFAGWASLMLAREVAQR